MPAIGHDAHKTQQEDEDGDLAKGRRYDRERRSHDGVLDRHHLVVGVGNRIGVSAEAKANTHRDEG